MFRFCFYSRPLLIGSLFRFCSLFRYLKIMEQVAELGNYRVRGSVRTKLYTLSFIPFSNLIKLYKTFMYLPVPYWSDPVCLSRQGRRLCRSRHLVLLDSWCR